jgi:hypothetical protein
VLRADNLITFMCRLSCNVGASNSWNSQGLSRPVQGLRYIVTASLEQPVSVTEPNLTDKHGMGGSALAEPVELLWYTRRYVSKVSDFNPSLHKILH